MSQIAITLILTGIAASLLVLNILRADLVALMLMLALGLTGILTTQEVFSGFSRSAVIIMLSAFILAEGLRRSGLTGRLGAFILQLFGKSEKGLVFGVMTAAAILSLFMNNIAAASLLIPSLSGMARYSRVSPSRLLMPLAFGTILGGMATLLTTTNIIASGLLKDANLQGYSLISFAPVGLPLALAGFLYMVFLGYRLLPEKSPAERHEYEPGSDDLLETYKLSDRLMRARVRKDGSLDGIALGRSGLREIHHLNVIAIQRRDRIISPEADAILHGDDILLIMSRPEDSLPDPLKTFMEVLPPGKWQEEYLSTPNLLLIEAAIAPHSPLAGQTLKSILFGQKFNAKVLAVWRHGRSIRTRLGELPLEFGDGLLLQGTRRSLELLKTEPGLILLAESTPSTRITRRGWLSAMIMGIALICGVIFPNLLAEILLTGAVLMVLNRTLSMDEAYRAVDWRSLFLMAGMLPLGVALNKTGASGMIAEAILSAFGNWGHQALLAGLILLTVLLTQVINGPAAVTIVVPIAIATALQTGMDPRSLAMAVALAGSIAFISPLGHSVNILVMGAGGYSFRDYARVGIPLTILLVILLLLLLPIFMPPG